MTGFGRSAVVCVCVCHTLFQRVSSSFHFSFQILDSFPDVTLSRGQQGVHSSAANEDSCEYSVKQFVKFHEVMEALFGLLLFGFRVLKLFDSHFSD